MNKSQPLEAHDREDFFFELMVDLDFTKHLGGHAASDQPVELCQIDADKYVLDVGCDVGANIN
jgi:hypothetical protein